MKYIFGRLKLWFDRSFAGGFFQQLIWAMGILLLVGLIALGIRGRWHEDAPFPMSVAQTVAEMISPVPFNKATFPEPMQAASPHETYEDRANIAWLFVVYCLGAIFFTGFLIAIITNGLRLRGNKHCMGDVHYHMTGHTVILGYGSISLGLIKDLLKKTENERWNKRCLLLQVSKNPQEVYQELKVQLSRRDFHCVVMVHAKRDSEEDLERMCIHNAKKVYLMGDEKEANHDAVNLKSLGNIANVLERKGCEKKLPCSILLNDQSTFLLFQINDVPTNVHNHIDYYPCNFYKNWARNVFVTCRSTANDIDYRPLDYEAISKDSNQCVHLVVVGMTKMGMTMATETAHIAHFPNFVTKGIRTKITLIDADNKEMFHIMAKYPHYFELSHHNHKTIVDNHLVCIDRHRPVHDFLDVEWEFIQGDVSHPCLQDLLSRWAADSNRLLTIAVCLNDDSSSMAIGYYLPPQIYERNVSVLIWQHVVSKIQKEIPGTYYANVRPFGMRNDGYEDDGEFIEMAKRVNLVYAAEFAGKSLQIADCKEEWDKLSIMKRFSNLYNALSIPTKLRSIGIDYRHPKTDDAIADKDIPIMAEVEHNRWNQEELLLRWRPTTVQQTLAVERNVKMKNEYKKQFIHYDIRPFGDLRVDETGKNVSRFDIALSQSMLRISQDFSPCRGNA